MTIQNYSELIAQDMRGFAYAVFTKGILKASGSFPSPEYSAPSESATLGALIKLADAYQGELYLGGYPKLMNFDQTKFVIGGLTWENVQRLQQKLPVAINQPCISERMPTQAIVVYSATRPEIFSAYCSTLRVTVDRKTALTQRAISMDDEGRYRDAGIEAHRALDDFVQGITNLDQFEAALNRIELSIREPLQHGDWITLRLGTLHWRWQGMNFGEITDTRLSEGRSNVVDPWRTSDGKTHSNLRDAKKHETNTRIIHVLKEWEFLPQTENIKQAA